MSQRITYHIQENIRREKRLHFGWKIVICGKTFAVAFLQTYIADRQGHDSWENLRGLVKNRKSIPPWTFSHIQ